MMFGYGFAMFFLLFILLAGVCAFIVASLLKLKRARVDEVSRVLWAFLIVLLPVAGSAVFFIVNPGGETDV